MMKKTARRPSPPFPDQGLSEPGIEERMAPAPEYEGKRYRPAGKLAGRNALITGGDSGIGRAVALMFAREGANVALVYLNEHEDAAAIRSELLANGRSAVLIPGDVCDADFCREAVEKTVETLGGLDVLVNNAAYQKHRDGIEDISLEQWSRTFRTNIDGYFFMVRAALPHLETGAVIINTGSITGLEGSANLLDYSATKGAIHAFTKSLAKNLVDRGIRVNCVAPGPVWTPLNPAELPEGAEKQFGAGTPMERPAQPDEIAPAYVYLASNADSSYVTGNILPILGGETIAG